MSSLVSKIKDIEDEMARTQVISNRGSFAQWGHAVFFHRAQPSALLHAVFSAQSSRTTSFLLLRARRRPVT
eukprot:6192472-Pleurochrysis_carterae.AAC.3